MSSINDGAAKGKSASRRVVWAADEDGIEGWLPVGDYSVRGNKARGRTSRNGTPGPQDFNSQVDQEFSRLMAREAAQERMAAVKGQSALAKFNPICVTDIKDPDPVELGTEGIFPVDQVSLLIGHENSAKTPLLMHTALMNAAEGAEFSQTHGRIGIYEGEMGSRRIARLIRSIVLPERTEPCDEEETDWIVYLGAENDPIDLSRSGAELVSLASDQGCDMLIVDSMVSMLSAASLDENGSTDVRRIVDALRKFPGTVIITDHTGYANTHRARGSSDKAPAVDFVVSVKVIKDGRVGANGLYRLQCEKDRNAYYIKQTMDVPHFSFDNATFGFTPLGWGNHEDGFVEGAKPEPQVSTTKQMIWDALTEPMTPSQIAAASTVKVASVNMALKRHDGSMFRSLGDGTWERFDD